MPYVIRDARPGDIPQVLHLMRQFAEHVGLSEYLTIDEDRLRETVFANAAFVHLLVASDVDKIVGYAIFYPHFSSFRGESGFFLEDIFIAREHRGGGVGHQLLGEIARRGKVREFSRIDFQVMTSNADALRFYERLGAESNPGEIRFKFAGPAFDRLAHNPVD